MLNEQSKHVAYVVKTAQDRQATRVETTKDAEEAWVQTIVSSALNRQRFAEECTPGYYNNEGQPSALAARNGSFGGGSIAFIKMLEDWRAAGELKGLELGR
jgi:cyclohexanone monooxygenase